MFRCLGPVDGGLLSESARMLAHHTVPRLAIIRRSKSPRTFCFSLDFFVMHFSRLWYNAVFPPPLVDSVRFINGTDITYMDKAANPIADDVFYGLWVISTSLALGLLLGFAIVQFVAHLLMFFWGFTKSCRKQAVTDEEKAVEAARLRRVQFRQQGVMKLDADEDPSEDMGDNGAVLPGSGEPAESSVPLVEKLSDSDEHVKLSHLHCGVLEPHSEANGAEENGAAVSTLAKMAMEKAEEEGFEVAEKLEKA